MNAPALAVLPAPPLKDPKLFRTRCDIDGEWVDGSTTFPILHRATVGGIDK